MWAWIRTPRGSTTTALVVAVILALLWFDPWTRPFGSDSAGEKPAPAGAPQPLASAPVEGGAIMGSATDPRPPTPAANPGGPAAPSSPPAATTASGSTTPSGAAPSSPAALPSPPAAAAANGPTSPGDAAPSGSTVASAGSVNPGLASATPGAAAPATSAPGGGASAAPSFDVVRVEPDGSTVVAGRAEPGSDVVLLDGDKPIARAQVDAGGQFALLPPALAAGDHALVLQSSRGDHAPVRSPQNVAVSVAAKAGTRPLVALLSPDKPAEILSDGAGGAAAGFPAPGKSAGSSPAVAPSVPLAIQAVEARQAGEFLAAGIARPGSSNRVYLNGAFVAEVTAGPNGHWSVEVRSGMAPGRYLVRADQVEPASGKVVNRVEVPFDYPVGGTAPTRMASAAPAAPAKAVVSTAPGGAGPAPTGGRPAVTAESGPAADGGNAPANAGSARVASAVAGSGTALSGPPAGAGSTSSGQPSATGTAPFPVPRPSASLDSPAAETLAAPASSKTAPAGPSASAPSGQPPATVPAPSSTLQTSATPGGPAIGQLAGTPEPATAAAGKAGPTGATPSPPAAESTAAASPEAAQDSAAVVVPDLKTKTVVRGDSLWRISRQMLGRGLRYTEIYASNSGQIKDPALIYPGQVFVVPTQRVD